MANNEIKFSGRITETPTYNDKYDLLNIKVAENHQRKNKDTGQWEDYSTTWHRITAWRDVAQELAANPEINKGAIVEVSARYESEREPWTDKDGNKRINLNLTANYVTVKFPPKEAQPAVKPAGGSDGFTPDYGDGAF